MFDRRKIKAIYFKRLRKVRNFLLSDKSREFLIFLFFVFIASGFWLLQTLNSDYETELSVPVRLKGVPDNVIVTSAPADELKVYVKDKGTVLLNYMLGKSFFPVSVNFKDYQSSQNSFIRIPTRTIQKSIMSQLSASTKILSVSPDTLECIYSTGRSKKIPVVLNAKLSTRRQYYVSDTIFQPDSVMVYAPEEILDTLSRALSEPIQFSDIADTTVSKVRLQSVYGAKFVPEQVALFLPVDMYTERVLEVPVLGINFPPDKVLRTFPSNVKVIFQVGVSNFYKVRAEDFLIAVSYEDLMNLNADKFKLILRSKPQNVSHVRIVPSEVDFLIEQIGGTND